MIGFIGLSHLGIVYSLATAAKGFEVLAFDSNAALCGDLDAGKFPIVEPGLSELFNSHRSRIRFSAAAKDLFGCELVFFSLDVPTDQVNRSDLGPLRKLIDEVADNISPKATVVILCQVPPGFTRALQRAFNDRGGPGAKLFYQVETLVFGNAVARALRPERYIVGCEDPKAAMPEAYARWLNAFGCPVLPMCFESAELTKISINLFLVSSVTTTNAIAELCEQVGADWTEIAPALRLDKRIGPHAYLSPGLGIAGGNLERDLVTVLSLAEQHGTDAGIVVAWQSNSRYRRDWVLRKTHELVLSKKADGRIAIWGLAYKPDTHSTKNSPSLALIEALAPFQKVAYDPQARIEPGSYRHLKLSASALDACRGADVLIIMTPWAEFSKIEPARVKQAMAGNVIIDPFGAFDREAFQQNGFSYHRLGVSD